MEFIKIDLNWSHLRLHWFQDIRHLLLMIMQERVSFYVSDQENYNEPYIYLRILKGFFWKKTFRDKNYEKKRP